MVIFSKIGIISQDFKLQRKKKQQWEQFQVDAQEQK